jgi:hypothetical protein
MQHPAQPIAHGSPGVSRTPQQPRPSPTTGSTHPTSRRRPRCTRPTPTPARPADARAQQHLPDRHRGPHRHTLQEPGTELHQEVVEPAPPMSSSRRAPPCTGHRPARHPAHQRDCHDATDPRRLPRHRPQSHSRSLPTKPAEEHAEPVEARVHAHHDQHESAHPHRGPRDPPRMPALPPTTSHDNAALGPSRRCLARLACSEPEPDPAPAHRPTARAGPNPHSPALGCHEPKTPRRAQEP